MSISLNLQGMASRLFSRPTLTTHTRSTLLRLAPPTTTSFSTTATPLAASPMSAKTLAAKAKNDKLKGKGKATGKKGRLEEKDPKLINMMKHFACHNPRNIPPPLRMARNRHLRHWTIHRGWLMFRRKQREERERNLMRQFQSMSAACEELRLTNGPGTRDMGYLYRVAMEKKGVYGHHGIPIEYARAQTDTPPKTPWNHEWKR